MPQGCALSLDDVTVAPKSMLVGRTTVLSRHRLEEVCRALATGCAP